MAWSTRHVFAFGELLTAANLNNNEANTDETMPAKVTTKADMAAATGANAISRIAMGSVRWWAPVTEPSQSNGIAPYPVPVILDHGPDTYNVNTTAVETDTWSKSLTAGMPGAKETLDINFVVMYTNNSGSSRTLTLKFYIGTTAYTITTGSIVSSATAYPIEVGIRVKQLNASNSQHVFFRILIHQVLGTAGNVSSIVTGGTGTDDFATSKTIKFSVTHSFSSANISAVVYRPAIFVHGGLT